MGRKRTDKLIEEIEGLLERSIMIIEITTRTAESFYNYKKKLLIVFKPLRLPWEEPDTRDLKVISTTAGVYQEYPVMLASILEEELTNKGYMVYVIDIF